jgi:hypothetical protein
MDKGHLLKERLRRGGTYMLNLNIREINVAEQCQSSLATISSTSEWKFNNRVSVAESLCIVFWKPEDWESFKEAQSCSMEDWSSCENADFMIAATASQATIEIGLNICNFFEVAPPPPAGADEMKFGSPHVFLM